MLVLAALGPVLAGAAVESQQELAISPLADGAFLLEAEQARLVKKGSEEVEIMPRLIPLLDGDGFAFARAIAPVAPADGALAWKLDVPVSGRYLVTLEFAHAQEGNAFEINASGQTLVGFAPDTRGSLVLMETGGLKLPAGHQTLLLRNTTAPAKAFMTVGSIYLRPVSQSAMTFTQIRAIVANNRPHQLPTELLLPRAFSEHMVLQQKMPVPVWGRSAPGSKVVVRISGQTKEAKTDAGGHWIIRLDPMNAGGPYEMQISNGSRSMNLEDVLVGEVWLGSGQSNMEVAAKPLPKFMTSGHPFDCDEDTRKLLATGVDSRIRISAITRDHWKNPAWSVLSDDNYLEAPALMTSVAILLREKLGVPVGIMVRCESSSTSGIWLSRDAVENDLEIQRQIRDYAVNKYPRLVAAYPNQVKEWESAAAQAKARGTKIPIEPSPPALPGGMPANRGFGVNLAFSEGRFDHYGANYFSRIEPIVPYAIRGVVWDQGENGTGIAGVDQLAVMPALLRSWRQAWHRQDLPFLYIRKNQHPATLAAVMSALTNAVQVDNRGLGQINHPPDKAAYARRVVEQMTEYVYNHLN